MLIIYTHRISLPAVSDQLVDNLHKQRLDVGNVRSHSNAQFLNVVFLSDKPNFIRRPL